MSGIFGIFNKDGAPVSPRHLKTMRSAMARWGPDGGGVWHDGRCGLGQVLLYNTPEALHERMPRAVNDRRLAITAEARVDNRDELCDLFDIPAAERPSTADGDLILHSYLRWGEECPNHIYGDWSFAVWQPDQQRLFVARDQHGVTGLYYVDKPGFFAFASSQKALLALPQVERRLNELKLAENMAYSSGDPEQTSFEGIEHLLPSHTLAITPRQREKRRYWFIEDSPEVRLPTMDAYVEGLQEVLERTVRSQLRSYRDVGLELSGGLDSGGLTGIAAPILADQGRSLFTYTAVPTTEETVPTGDRVADESPWVHDIVQHVGNIRDHYRDFAQSSPLAEIEQFHESHDAPMVACGNAHWLLGFRSLAREQGIGVLMNGYMGNATASWSGLLRSQAWTALLLNGRWKSGLRDKLLSLLPYAALKQFKRWRLGRDYWQNWTVIRPEFAQRMRLGERLVANEHDLKFHNITSRLPQHQLLSAREQRLSIIEPGRWRGGASQGETSAWYGLETRIPLADARLMAYCLGIPDRYYCNGVDRGLFRRALAERLPKHILWNGRRGLQGADLVGRVRRHRHDLEQALALIQGDPSITPYVDTARLQNLWSRICGTGTTDRDTWLATRVFMNGLGFGMFLRRYLQGDETLSSGRQIAPGSRGALV